jgi:nucleotide-binding universal stress UspA family protein
MREDAMSTTPVEGQPILVGVDGSDFSKAALTWAAAQARLTGSPLQVVISWTFPANLGYIGGLPDIDFGGDAKSTLEETVHEVLGDHAGLEVHGEVVEGHAALVLTELSEHASLVVVGTRGHGGFVGLVIGSVSEYVVAHAHCPVVVVRH